MYEHKGFNITPVACDHGELAPHAVGLIITSENITVYITGDTAFRPDIAYEISKLHPDILIAPINGAFGNMNEEQATDFCEIIMPKLMIPCHFRNFAEHGENPGVFAECMKSRLPRQNFNIMRPSECLIYKKER